VALTPKRAWLLGVLWVLKVVPGIPGLRQLRRVLVQESGPLLSVLVIFLMVLFLASVAVYFWNATCSGHLGSVPAAMWWAVVTLTTVGYGDIVPITVLGRMIAALVMICGLGVFGLWTGILATGFAAETRRDNFLKTWDSVTKVPFFAALGPSAIADVTHMLRTMDLPPRTMIIRKGQTGDCMYSLPRAKSRSTCPAEGAAQRRRVLRRDRRCLDNESATLPPHQHTRVELWCSTASTPPADGAACAESLPSSRASRRRTRLR